MKHMRALLEFTAFLQVIYAIYGICGAYEQNIIDGLQLAEYLLIFCITLIANIACIKALTAAIESKNDQFRKFESNRSKPHYYDNTKL